MEGTSLPTPAAAPAEWLEALAEAEADVAAGRVVPAALVLQELRASLAQLQAKPAKP
jgi:hypothetical protein